MAEFKNDELGVSFTVPDRLTVRQQLAYFSQAGLAQRKEFIERLWLGAKNIIEDWKCDLIPDIEFDLEKNTNTRVTQVIIWASLEVKKHFDALDDIPKN